MSAINVALLAAEHHLDPQAAAPGAAGSVAASDQAVVRSILLEGAPGGERYREARGKPPYRTVPYLFVGPSRGTAIGELAARVVRAARGLKSLRSPDFTVLTRLLGGETAAQGELLSFPLRKG